MKLSPLSFLCELTKQSKIIQFKVKQGKSESEKETFKTYINLLDFLANDWVKPIYHSELLKIPKEDGAILQRVKRKIQIRKNANLEYEMVFSNDFFDRKGLIT